MLVKKEERSAEFKDRLRDAMASCNIKAVKLSEKSGVPKGAISYYLAGKSQPRAERLNKIANALNVSEAWLLGFDVSMQMKTAQKKKDDIAKALSQLKIDADFVEVVYQLADLPDEQYDSVKNIILSLGEK